MANRHAHLNPPDRDIPDTFRKDMHDKLDAYLDKHQNIVIVSLDRDGSTTYRSASCSLDVATEILTVAVLNSLSGEADVLSHRDERDL